MNHNNNRARCSVCQDYEVRHEDIEKNWDYMKDVQQAIALDTVNEYLEDTYTACQAVETAITGRGFLRAIDVDCNSYICSACKDKSTCKCTNPRVLCPDHVHRCHNCEAAICTVAGRNQCSKQCFGGVASGDRCPNYVCIACKEAGDTTCQCGHDFCKDDTRECHMCDTVACEGCSEQCFKCRKNTCYRHAPECDLDDKCQIRTCVKCTYGCDICGNVRCIQHLLRCSTSSCGAMVCIDDACVIASQCVTCMRRYCEYDMEQHQQEHSCSAPAKPDLS
jgi:hypothetical protein